MKLVINCIGCPWVIVVVVHMHALNKFTWSVDIIIIKLLTVVHDTGLYTYYGYILK